MTVITFLSDFGLKDEYVSVCKGVIKEIVPSAEIIDISHQVPKFDVGKGAFMLAAAAPYIKALAHLAVVDPGVGSKRRGLVIQSRRGDFLVGPDNGLLNIASRRLGGIKRVVVIENRKYMLEPVSSTFHARDIFAPAAAHLVKGARMGEFGKEPKLDTLIASPLKDPLINKGRITGEIVDIDDFGTARLNCEETHLKEAGISLQKKVIIEHQSKRFELPYERSFASVDEGLPLALVDSTGFLCLAVNQGSAQGLFGFSVGDAVVVSSSGLRVNPRNS